MDSWDHINDSETSAKKIRVLTAGAVKTYLNPSKMILMLPMLPSLSETGEEICELFKVNADINAKPAEIVIRK